MEDAGHGRRPDATSEGSSERRLLGLLVFFCGVLIVGGVAMPVVTGEKAAPSPARQTFTIVIDDRNVGTFTTDDRGGVDMELREGEIPPRQSEV